MPIQVQRRQSEPIPVTQKSMQQHQALRLALGSILTPKRPPVHQSSNSHSSSGAASPAVFFAGAHSSSGSHTPIGSPPNHPFVPIPAAGGGSVSYYPLAHGPNSSEHLHPYHPYGHTRSVGHTHTHGHSHTHIPLPPSRLGPGRSPASNSPTSSAPNSSHPSPTVSSSIPASSDIEPLSMPPPVIITQPHDHHAHHHNGLGGIDPPPPTPSTANGTHHPSVHDPPAILPTDGHGNLGTMMGVHSGPIPGENGHDAASNGTGSHSSGRVTPRAKFLEALQGKSAWDALIHGSFS